MKIKLNRIIKYLILADLAFWSGCGLIAPVFAIFIADNIVGGNAVVAGIAFGIYWTVKSFFQYPIGLYLDGNRGDKDDYFFLVFGFLISSLVPVGYTFVQYPWQVFILQVFYGIGMAMSIAGWRALFTRSIDKGQESGQWSLDDALLGFGQGIFGLVSGLAVFYFGFKFTFIISSCLGLMSVILLLQLRSNIKGVFDENILVNFRKIFLKK